MVMIMSIQDIVEKVPYLLALGCSAYLTYCAVLFHKCSKHSTQKFDKLKGKLLDEMGRDQLISHYEELKGLVSMGKQRNSERKDLEKRVVEKLSPIIVGDLINHLPRAHISPYREIHVICNKGSEYPIGLRGQLYIGKRECRGFNEVNENG